MFIGKLKVYSALILIALVGCSDNKGQSEHNRGTLIPATSDAAIVNAFAGGLGELNRPAGNLEVVASPAVQSSAASDADSGGQFSRTYLQVDGVDEADVAKYDGEHWYLNEQTFASQGSIRVLQTFANPPQVDEINSIATDVGNSEGMYFLPGNNGDPNLLVQLQNSGFRFTWNSWLVSIPDQFLPPELDIPPEVNVRAFDVGIPENTDMPLWQLRLSGNLAASRRIGDQLYLLTHYTPVLEDFIYYPSNDQERRQNQNIINRLSGADILPSYQLNNDAPVSLSSNDCLLPADPANAQATAIVTLTTINLRSPTSISQTCFVGHSNSYFVSREAVYLTATDFTDFQDTIVHKFSFAGEGTRYRGSHVVPGLLSTLANPRYLMGEDKGTFRIVTTENLYDFAGDSGGPNHRLTLIREQGDGDLVEVSHLPNEQQSAPIGKPHEHIYAVRYVNGRAYIVTFLKTDPLYVIDLQDENNPEVAGELEVSGYSSLLHPVGDDLLLGIGQDSAASGNDTFAWFQGIKLELFNVSDIANPQSQGSIVIGERGTSSPVIHDFHALSLLQQDNTLRIAMPIRRHDTIPDNYGGQPFEFFDFTDAGLFLFEITNTDNAELSQLQETGAVIVEQAGDNVAYFGEQRSVLDGDTIHYSIGQQVWSSQWDSPEIVVGPQ